MKTESDKSVSRGEGGGPEKPKTTSRQYPNKNKGGAPKGNRNALKHGRYRREMRELRVFVTARLRAARAAIKLANGSLMVRQAHHEAQEESLTLSLSKGEVMRMRAKKKGEP